MINGLKVYDAVIDDRYDGVYAISLVESPAVESNFQLFEKSDNKKQVLFAVENEEKHDVLGVVLRADYPIYRNDNGYEYYLNFTAESIKQFAEQILQSGSFKWIDLNHDEYYDVEGVKMREMFIKDSSKGIAPKGFEDIADGSLFALFHIDSMELWEKIKSGEFNGFSVEAYLTANPQDFDNQINKNENMSKLENVKELVTKFFSALNEALSEEEVAQSAPSNEIATEETAEEEEEQPADTNDEEETEETIEFIPDEETEEIEEEQSEDTDEDFEARIAELQSQIEELTNTNTQLSSQIEELKKTAPSLTELSKNEVNTETRKTGTMLDYLAQIKR